MLGEEDVRAIAVKVRLAQCARALGSHDDALVLRVREEIERLPGSAEAYYRYGAEPAAPRSLRDELPPHY